MARQSSVLLLALVAAASGCATAPPPDPKAPLEAGLLRHGTLVARGGRGDPLVVVVKDRHTTHGAITRARDVFARIRRENRAAVGFLVGKGFTLVGCEAPLGPLAKDAIADRHRLAIREAILDADDLDALTVYQPLRYEIEFEKRARVVGVEDPGRYADDVRALETILDCEALAARNDRPEPERIEALRTSRRLRREITGRVEERGSSRRELLGLLRESAGSRAVLVMGGAHHAGIVKEFERESVPFLVFECKSYRAPP